MIKISRLIALLLVALMFSSAPVSAEPFIVEGQHSKLLKRECKDGMPRKVSDYNEVLEIAKVDAMRSWVAQGSVATGLIFAENEQKLIAEIDNYFIKPDIRVFCGEKNPKLFKLIVKLTVDENKINLLGKKVSGPRSRITALFLARRQDTVKSYDSKDTSIVEKTTITDGAESNSVSGASASSEGYSSSKDIVVTGGSSVRKADKITWNVFRASALDAAVNQTLTSFGFKPIDVSQVASRFPGFDLEAFKQDFTFSDEIDPDTKNNAFNAIAGKIPILIIATVDIGVKDIDENGGGLDRVAAVVTAQVFKDDGMFYETVASVEPTLFRGLGENQTVAETNALIKAARNASTEIVQQLNAAGIQ